MGKGGWLLVLGFCVILNVVDVLHWWRVAIFLISYSERSTAEGYLAAAKSFDSNDMDVDLRGRTFLITGANSGIGRSTAMELAKQGGIVHTICRNPERAEKVKNDIIARTRNQEVHTHILDMSNIGNIHLFAQEFASRYRKLDVLINNAACMIHERTLTPEDLELNFATNTMGYYTLTTALLPLLNKSEDARVVMVGSGGLLMAELVVHDLQCENTLFDGDKSYIRQKRHQLVIAEELAKLHPDIHFSIMNPGWVDTPSLKKFLPEFYNSVKEKLRTPDQGADTAVWLAASDTALLHESGRFFMDREPVPTHLPFGLTKETESDRKKLMKQIAKISERLKPDELPHQFFKDD